MGRLIDAEKCPCYTCRTQCCENPMRCTFFGMWLRKQAYDVEAVVAELEKHRHIDRSCGDVEYSIYLDEAIEIVRSGGKE